MSPVEPKRPRIARDDPRSPAGRAAVPPVVDIPTLDGMIGYKLRRAQLAVFHDFIDAFAAMQLRPTEFAVLALIAGTPGLKQSEIAGQLGIKRANFVALMDGLERRDLARRRKGERDKRSHSLHLTQEGIRFVERMTVIWAEHEKRLIDRLGGLDARDELVRLLDRLMRGPD